MANVEISAGDSQWQIVGRWQEYEAEARVNVFRLVAIAAFYAIELLNYKGGRIAGWRVPPGVHWNFHAAMTAIVAAWLVMAGAVRFALHARYFPPRFMYATVSGDLFFLTLTLALADGAKSPLAAIYFVLMASSALRFNLRLVAFTTLLCIVSYVCLFRGPLYVALIFILALGMTGALLAYVVARARAIAHDWMARRLGSERG